MHLFVHFHLPQLYYAPHRELTQLYAHVALRKFTLGLIGIFVPIYVFLFFSQDISKTLLYFGAISFIYGILSPLSGKVITKVGIKHSMLLSLPFLFAYYVALWQIEKLGPFLFILVVFAVVHNVFYWPAFHIDFARFSEGRHRSKQLSYRHAVVALAGAASPLAGGIILSQFGFPILFAIVLAMLFASIFPLFLSKEIRENYTDSFQKTYGELTGKKHRNKIIAFGGEGAEVILHIIVWPIFLFVLSISYSSIGLISSAALFAGVIFALYLGRVIDKMGHARLLALGSWLNAFTWPLKMFVATPIDAFLVNTFHQFTRLTAHMPFSTLFYDWSARDDINRDRFIILREVGLNISRGGVLILLAAVFLFVDNLAIVFPLAGAFSLLLMFFTKGSQGTRQQRQAGQQEAR